MLAKLAAKDNPQTMLGVFEQRWARARSRAGSRRSLWVALEAVRDPGNLGTIIRTADAVGAGGVILIGTSCDPYSREAVRASMGSIFNVPLVRMTARGSSPGPQRGRATSSARTCRAARISAPCRYRAPTLLAMGSEGPGLSADAGAPPARASSRSPWPAASTASTSPWRRR